MEIQVYKGIPLKPEKSLQKAHNGFINKVGFTKTDQGAHFVAVSGDKNLSVYDTATTDCLIMQPVEHAQGINDFAFTHNENEIVTVSSDRTARVHGIDFEGKTLEHRFVLNYSDFDSNGYTDNVEKQVTGAVFSDVDHEFFTVNNISDINVWRFDELTEKPVATIRGHSNAIRAMTVFGGNVPVTGDNDGRLLSWNVATGMANRPTALYRHKVPVTCLASNSKYVYSGAGNSTLMAYEMKEMADLQPGLSMVPVLNEFCGKHASPALMQATESLLYIMYFDKSMQILKADNIEECVAESPKLEEVGEAKGKATCFAVCEARNEMIVCDNKGYAHIFDATTLAPKGEAAMQTHYMKECISVAVSPDNTKFAVGDSKGYVTVFDMESRAKICYIYGHKSKVYNCEFTPDSEWCASFSQDQSFILGLISNTQGNRKLDRTSEFSQHTCMNLMHVDGESFVLAAGYDCAVRIWKY